ncbi:aminoglycoside phosphotransferase family protein [Nocardiopsis sp. N85]|uniref:phosphotransferase family protein n=1 Tax=Nocardiopsis sp. N85 TaxID=3029400 RepID=UPI00237EF76C|nr:aminoglycoside phosphotransferase family protein [Nocardiopsis sp. N85]MDE3721857.1 aminoglycoside phosphotransferase family protein [Nocardiopsis sp. N85]
MNTPLVEALLRSALGPRSRVRHHAPLTGGTYNTVHLVTLADGTDLVLKIEPPSHQPRLTYEHRITRAEARVYALARPALGALIPEPLHLGTVPDQPGRHYLAATRLPGVPLDRVREGLTPDGLAGVRHDLGRAVAALHTITGEAFGYPENPPLRAPTWPEAFTAMVEAVLTDAHRHGVRLPRAPDEIRARLRTHLYRLEAVRTPVLVHFDLWDGNVLVDGAPDTPALSGVIDGERAFWGDPVADLASLALFGDIRRDTAFLTGYRDAGGHVEFTPDTLHRLALYRTYLYLIMYTEPATRAVPTEEAARLRAFIGPLLEAELDTPGT